MSVPITYNTVAAIEQTQRRKARKSQSDIKEVEIGIGLSMGRVIMGNMGCTERMEHTVIGATVNLAARLCAAAKSLGNRHPSRNLGTHW